MSLKWKQAQLRQKEYFEKHLQNRLAFLSSKGIEASKADKDPLVKKLKASVRAVNNRLRLIAENEKRTEDMARKKAERAAAPKEQEAGKAEKPKKAPEEAKPKKAKPEKKPAPPIDKGTNKEQKPAARSSAAHHDA